MKWSNEDLDYLESKWGEKSIKTIAAKLNRSENAIILKAKRLGLGSCYKAGESINANEVSKIMGVDRHCVTGYWMTKCGLKAKKKSLKYYNYIQAPYTGG